MTGNAAERLQAFREKQEGPEAVQNRIALRIGDNGWLVLGEMSDAERARLATLERQGRLSDKVDCFDRRRWPLMAVIFLRMSSLR
jgi:hypothetical protein